MVGLGEAYPPETARVSGRLISKELFQRLRHFDLIGGARPPRRVNFVRILKRLDELQARAADSSTRRDRGKKVKKAAGSGGPVIHTLAGLQATREQVARFLIAQYGIRGFMPLTKTRKGIRITACRHTEGAIQRWLSVWDEDQRDMGDWVEERVCEKGEVFTVVDVAELYRCVRGRARLVRIWLPTLGLLVHFTPGGDSGDPSSGVHPRRGYIEFPLKVLWVSLGVETGSPRP